MVLDFKVNARLVVGMTINFFVTTSRLRHRRTYTISESDSGRTKHIPAGVTMPGCVFMKIRSGVVSEHHYRRSKAFAHYIKTARRGFNSHTLKSVIFRAFSIFRHNIHTCLKILAF